jgi:glycine/D-amino acid oxidase-like deaminating enzyme
MTQHDVLVIGAGIFGATIARGLARRGLTVRVFDDGRPLSGSAASGCLMKPSWYSSLDPEVYRSAMAELETAYGVQDITLKLWPSKRGVAVKWVPREKFLRLDDLDLQPFRVTGVEGLTVTLEENEVVEARLAVVVAAGYWARDLLGEFGARIQGKAGTAVFWDNHELPAGFIRPWAPYKQMVAFQEGPGKVWAGDGTAILYERWDEKYPKKTVSRLAKATRLRAGEARSLVGIRPFVRGVKPCLLEEVTPGLWVATGGAKSGTLGAGWAAAELGRRLAGG